MFERYKRNRALSAYVGRLPALLRNEYGQADAYSPDQITSQIERHGLSHRYRFYAVALFAEETAARAFLRKEADGEEQDFDHIATIIANRFNATLVPDDKPSEATLAAGSIVGVTLMHQMLNSNTEASDHGANDYGTSDFGGGDF